MSWLIARVVPRASWCDSSSTRTAYAPREPEPKPDSGAGDAEGVETGDAGGEVEPLEEVRSKILLPRRTRMILNFTQVVTVMGEEEGATPDVTIAVDPETNAIILIGSSRATERAEELLRLLQEQLPAQPGRVRVVNLPDGVQAWTVASTVNATVSRLGRLSERNPGGMTGAVSVVADPRGGALVLASNDTDFETIGPLIGALTQSGASGAYAVRVYELSNNDARGTTRAINQIMNPPGVRRGQLVTVSLPVGDGEEVREATFNAGSVSVTVGPSSSSLIVVGPSEAMPVVDAFVLRLDDTQPLRAGLIRRYALEHARAQDLVRTMRDLFNGVQRSAPRGSTRPASFTADARTNALLVAATDEQHEEIASLLGSLDTPEAGDEAQTRIFRLSGAEPNSVARVLERVLGAEGDPSVRVTPERGLGLVIVRGPRGTLERAADLVAEFDTPATEAFESVSLKLERADANEVARALQRFFDDRSRASATPGQRPQRRVSIVGDRRTSTLLVAASPGDLVEVKELIAEFDAPAEARDLKFRVFRLENASVSELLPTVQELLNEGRFTGMTGVFSEGVIVRSNARTNSIVALGRGDGFDELQGIIDALDVAPAAGVSPVVRVFKIASADLRVLRDAVEAATSDPGASQRWWEPADPTEPRFEIDEGARSLIVIAPESRMDGIAALVEQLDTATEADQVVRTVQLTFADANQAANSLARFFRDRARQAGLRQSRVAVVGSRAGNAIIISGPEEEMALAEDIASKLDSPDTSDDQSIEVFVLEHAEASDVARSVRSMFPRRGRSDSRVTASPDARTNAVIVSAPNETMPQVTSLIDRLDEFPEGEAVAVRTFPLESARADEVAQTLRDALADDGDRRFVDDDGTPIEVNASITAERRSNTVLVTADEASMRLVEGLIADLDAQPAAPEREYRVLPLEHVLAIDVATTLRALVGRQAERDGTPPPNITSSRTDNTILVNATPDQFEKILSILGELDTPGRDTRETEFVALEFADAEQVRRALGVFYGRFASAADTPGARNVNIVADTATNSLVINAPDGEWEGIRALIAQLDSEEYDASRRLEVIAVQHADARSVAEAINRAFEAPLRNELERERREREQRQRRGREEGFFPLAPAPDVLVEQEEFVSVSSEPITNTLIVSATKRNLERVQAIVAQIDVPEFAAQEAPRVIVLPASSRPSVVAQALSRMYESTGGGRRSGARARDSVRIVGDDAAGVLVVRAEDETFAEIESLALALAAETDRGAVNARILPVVGQPAVRLRDTLLRTFRATAQQRQEPFSVEVDRASNALIVASSEDLFEEMRRVVDYLNEASGGGDGTPTGMGSGAGQRLVIVRLENSDPQSVIQAADRLGLTRPAPADRPGVLAEPVTLTALTSQRAIALLVTPGDALVAEAILRTLDGQPDAEGAVQASAIVPLEVARAEDVAQSIERLLAAESQGARTGVASALAEQVRRLRIENDDAFDGDIDIDLSKPIRLIPQGESNALIVASTDGNVAALRELITMLDRLPIGDAVIIRMFHLQHASASRTAQILDDLFREGESLRRTPGTQLRTVPTTETGRALIGEIAVSTDERTNALIVAGREEAVALAEVLIGELDAEREDEWVEPRLLPLRFADAEDVAETVRRVVVEGVEDGPGSEGLRRQVARLRVMGGGDGAIESELFVPMTRLQIIPENNLNALIVTGTPANVGVVSELVAMLDVEGASRLGSLRFFPLEHAAADRVADLLRSVFADQRRLGAIREEDELIVNADLRTNALIVSTSPRSFAVVEALVRSLDVAEASSTVGLHVVQVPRGDVTRLAQRIESVMRDRLRALEREGAQRRDVISIEPDEASRSLIVAASEENLAMIRQLVGVLGGDDAGGGEGVDLVQVVRGKASDIVPLVNELYVRDANRQRGDGSVRVSADARLNAVVVAGTDEDVEAIRELVGRLDTSALSAVREIKIVEMTSANALEMVNLLQNVLSGRSLAGRGTDAQATMLRFVRQRAAQELGLDPEADELTETEVSSAIRERVSLTPDLRTNSIVVSAPPAMMVMIESMIETLDSSAS
ncbi:MAG: secretin N-terminal domain-containing protein, partial [Planctomycetota bacterium]